MKTFLSDDTAVLVQVKDIIFMRNNGKLPKRIKFPINYSPKILNNNLNLPSVIPKKSKLTNIPYNQIKTEENENINKINTRNVQLRVPNLTSIKKKEFHNKEEAKIVPLIFPKINNNISQYKFK